MINQIVLMQVVIGSFQPETSKTVAVYEHHASDAEGGPPNGSLVGAATEVGNGLYTIDITRSKKVSIVEGSLCRAGMIGVMVHGDKALSASVDSAASDLVGDF